MATVQPRHERNDPNAGMQGAYYTVDVAMGGFLDTETINGGRMSPCAANDFATKPTTLAQSLLVSRGQLRYKLMLKILYIQDKIAEPLNTTHTENMTVYDPTSGQGQISNDAVTVGPVLSGNEGEIVEAITVAEVAGFRANVDAETPTDEALTYSAE